MTMTAAIVALTLAAAGCGGRGPASKVYGEAGGRVTVEDIKKLTRTHASEAASAAGAKLIIVSVDKVTCDDVEVDNVEDVYAVDAVYNIDVKSADRAAAVKKVADLWKSKGYRTSDNPAPNNAEASTDDGTAVTLEPTRNDLTLPLHVNTTCHTSPA